MDEFVKWFEEFRTSNTYSFLEQKQIAYFCSEFALTDILPTYAGGLGVLAADYVLELAAQKIPAVAVGLFYKERYTDNPSRKKGEEVVEDLHIFPLLDSQNKRILIKVPILDTYIYSQVWIYKIGQLSVYLLDSDIEDNSPTDRNITHKLYDSSKETRLKQEMILGIGGFRLLELLGVNPSIYHMNEGHSAMLALEIIRHEMQKRQIGFKEAQALSTHHVVFTNHTLVAAGNEIYARDLFTLMLAKYASELEVPVAELVALGLVHESSTFSMSLFALRLAGKINAVSKLHAKTAAKIWPQYQIDAVTNGIYLPRWDSTKSDSNLWDIHQQNKKRLLEYIKKETGLEWKEDELLLGWARRIVRYKRPLALLGEIDELKSLATQKDKPIKIIFSGSVHPRDDEGKELLKELQRIIKEELYNISIFLPDYSIDIAKLLTSGCDIWLNTPVVGSEACGTSGMKACFNGVLPCTTKDGWIDEVDLNNIGWILENDRIHQDLIDTLRDTIVPLYYERNEQNIPQKWEGNMTNARNLILQKFSTTRMLKEYFEKMYLPIITSSYEHYSS